MIHQRHLTLRSAEPAETAAETVENPADELARIRVEIARLKAREAELRMAFLTTAETPKIGRWHKVELVTERRTVFEPRLLPPEIRNDPHFIRERVSRKLVTKPLGTRPFAVTCDPLVPARPSPRARLFAGLGLH